MISFIRKKLKDFLADSDQEEFNHGFAWALSEYFSGRMTPYDIEGNSLPATGFDNLNEAAFDRGASVAVKLIIEELKLPYRILYRTPQ